MDPFTLVMDGVAMTIGYAVLALLAYFSVVAWSDSIRGAARRIWKWVRR